MVGQDLILPCGYIFHSVSFLYKLYFLHVLADTKSQSAAAFTTSELLIKTAAALSCIIRCFRLKMSFSAVILSRALVASSKIQGRML